MAYFLRGAFAMGLNDAPSGERIHIGFSADETQENQAL